MLRKKSVLVLLAILAILVIMPACDSLNQKSDSPVGPTSLADNPSQKDEDRGPQKTMAPKDPMKWPTSVSDFQWPFAPTDYNTCGANSWNITCGYGRGWHVNGGRSYPHGGYYSVDFMRTVTWRTRGSWVLAPARGKVIYADNTMSGYGWAVIMDHGGGFLSIVAHLDSDPKRWVNVGNDLRAGTFLGYCGSSGGNWAPHIHFCIWKDGVSVPLAGVSGDWSIYEGGTYYSGNTPVRPPANSPW